MTASHGKRELSPEGRKRRRWLQITTGVWLLFALLSHNVSHSVAAPALQALAMLASLALVVTLILYVDQVPRERASRKRRSNDSEQPAQ